MGFIADLHIHSHFSRATSRQLDLEHLWISAQLKGISVVGTGDFPHPGWLVEMTERLVPAGGGLYARRPDLARALRQQVPPSCRGEVRFMPASCSSTRTCSFTPPLIPCRQAVKRDSSPCSDGSSAAWKGLHPQGHTG